MEKRRELTVEREDALLSFLREKVRDKSRNTVKGLLSRGQVLVDGALEKRFDAPLRPGQRVTILPESAAGAARLPFPVLYEDGELVAVDKPAGLLSVGNEKERQRTAYRLVSGYVKAADPAGKIFVVHRLDRDTSGVLLFAKDEGMKRALQDGWDGLVRRRAYLAVVEGAPPREEGTIRTFLHEDAGHRVWSGPRGRDGKEAVTRYRVLDRRRGLALLEVELDTGRKNQIRVHMAELGCPVSGDRKYGSGAGPMGRLALHACQLQLVHPRSRSILALDAPAPQGFRKLFPGAGL